MFEYVCPKCTTPTQTAAIPNGEIVACTQCGQQFRVVVEGENNVTLLREGAPPPPAPAPPPVASGAWLIGICGGAGLTVAAIIVIVWALLDRGSGQPGRPGEQVVAQGKQEQQQPGDRIVQPVKLDPIKAGDDKKVVPAKQEPDGKKEPAVPDGPAKQNDLKSEVGLAPPPVALTDEQVYEKILKSKSTVWICWVSGKYQFSGSGSLINRDRKLILTNWHVVTDLTTPRQAVASEVRVFFPEYRDGNLITQGEHYQAQMNRGGGLRARVVKTDKEHDLGLIVLLDEPPADARPLPLSVRRIMPGQRILSIGNPGASDGRWVCTTGSVRSVHPKKWDIFNALVVETQSPTNHGDSGGPLLNEHAELIAVTQGGRAATLELAGGRLTGRVKNPQLMSWFIHVDEVKRLVKSEGYSWVEGQAPAANVLLLAKLRQSLRSKDVKTVQAAAAHLAQFGPDAKAAVSDLIKALQHQDATVRQLACRALGQIGDDAGAAAPQLTKLLDDPEARIDALDALARLGRAAAVALPKIIQLLEAAAKEAAQEEEVLERSLVLQGQHREVQESALRVLASLGSEARASVPTLARLLPTAAPKLKLSLIETLWAIGPDAAPASAALGEVLREQPGDKKLRQAALRTLYRIGSAASPALPGVRGALKDTDLDIRRLAIIVLEKVGLNDDSDQTTIAILETLLGQNPPPLLVIEAMVTWKALGPKARFAVPYLYSLDHSKNHPSVRKLANEILDKTGDRVQQSDLPIFVSALLNKELSAFVRAYAGGVLEKQMSPKLALPVPALERLLRERDFRVRGAAARLLGKLGPRAKEAIPSLVRLLADDKDNDSSTVRLNAVIALIALGPHNPEAAVPALTQTLRDPDALVRLNAGKALAAIGPQADAAVPNLILGLQDADRQVKMQCAWTLGRIGPKAAPAVQPLTIAAYSQDTGLRTNAAYALGQIGPQAASAVEALLQCLRENKGLRLRDSKAFSGLWGTAAEALGKIGPAARKRIGKLELLKKSTDWWQVTGLVCAVEKSFGPKDNTKGHVDHINAFVLPRMHKALKGYQFTAERYRPNAQFNLQARQFFEEAQENARMLAELIRLVDEAVARLKQ